MAFQFHTYGPSCRLRVPQEEDFAADQIPRLRSQFFHYSRQPIDEPLSSTPSTAEPVIRPFSAYDNDRLEDAWQSFLRSKAEEKQSQRDKKASSSSEREQGSEGSAPKRLKTSRYDEEESMLIPDRASQSRGRNSHLRVGDLQDQDSQASREHRGSLDTPRPSLAAEYTPQGSSRRSTIGSQHSPRPLQRAESVDSRDEQEGEEAHSRTSSRPKLAPRKSTSLNKPKVETTVGLSRLHAAVFPDYNVKPIYWGQASDVAPIMRATWFYKATMEPVEGPIANLLEKGYQYMKPWTQTYKDEVASCLAVGPEAEIHLVHPLVPESELAETLEGIDERVPVEDITIDKAYKSRGFLKKINRHELLKSRRNFSVIYANSRSAQILRPNQIPSVSRGRRPLKFIVKEQEVGTVVVRGFDPRIWDKKHPLKDIYPPSQYRRAKAHPRSRVSGLSDSRNVCQACEAEKEDPNVTDLVLVIHGIGQKLSEKRESFAFTHAITTLRRDMTELLLSEEVQPILRPNLGTIVPLPINWRAKMKAEEMAFQDDGHDAEKEEDRFSLNDVTVPYMLPTRGFINDVFADIPYYMSNRQEHILSTVVHEANRVYNEWCKHTPGFRENGRVHIIAHSLGSVIAMDILSQQPTTLQNHNTSTPGKGIRKLFDFDTKSVFFLGSPLGFFFHLHHKKLVPRKNRRREGSDVPVSAELGSEGGVFGCPAVDNIYNVIHPQDPVSYRLNPCVDVKYASGLKPAFLPTLATSWMPTTFGLSRRIVPLMRPTTSSQMAAAMARSSGGGSSSTLATNRAAINNNVNINININDSSSSGRPSLAKLPSTVEMEVHDFTKEERAENKMFLLNDNGQIDWMMALPRGFELPYLSVLYAHSSYWSSRDLVRFLVVELGREPGRGEALTGLRAAKRGLARER